MSEKKLTQDQKDRLNAIKKEWEIEIEKMEKEIPSPDGRHLDGPRTTAHTRLASKYMPMIQAIMEESNG